MVRLALVCQSYPPMISGASIVVGRLAEGLARRGHAVLVIAASDRGPGYVTEAGGLRVARLRSWHNPFRVGQRAVLFPRSAVAAELRAFRPDVVHAHDPVSVGLAGLLEARALGAPTVLTLHQLPWFVSAYLPVWAQGLGRWAEQALWAYSRWLARRVDALVAPSRTIADIVAARLAANGGGEQARAPLPISNGVDLERFTPEPAGPDEGPRLRQKYGLDPARPILLHVGRLDADKRADLVVRAAAAALRAVDAQLLVVGDGRERAAVERLAADLGLAGRARFTGYVPVTGDLPGLYRLASVFVTASEVEIQSSVVMEAAAAGLPVVAVRASSMAEFVEDGRNGYLAPPRDVEALGAILARLIRDPEHARALGLAGRALAEAHSPERTLAAHEALYQRVRRAPAAEL